MVARIVFEIKNRAIISNTAITPIPTLRDVELTLNKVSALAPP